MEKQQGILVFINGSFIGMDIISQVDVYADLHHKLLKSYLMEALIEKKKKKKSLSSKDIEKFLQSIQNCQIKKFKSITVGWDIRISGNELAGTALVYRNEALHLSVFRMEESAQNGSSMAGYRRRRGWRNEDVFY